MVRHLVAEAAVLAGLGLAAIALVELDVDAGVAAEDVAAVADSDVAVNGDDGDLGNVLHRGLVLLWGRWWREIGRGRVRGVQEKRHYGTIRAILGQDKSCRPCQRKETEGKRRT